MKNMYRYFSLFFLVFLHQVSMGQVNIQVTILPPYQSDITVYGSRPDLVMINLTNTTSQELSLQLHGSISGENGIMLSTKANTRSSQAIVLPPLGTTQVNGVELADIFDLNQVDMVGIEERDFTNGRGLPEGNYSFCVRAFDYNDLSVPLSPEEPLGCTYLNINDHEPPIITSPYEDQEISADGGTMGFNISWMTTGAPIGVQYNLKIVEILSNQNPRDVFESANPIFETPVQSNFFFYGPQHPPLVPGRQYVMSVEAKDPTGKTHFRNNGQSELVVFTYGEEAVADSTATASTTPRRGGKGGKKGDPIEDNEFATNRIKGKLLWGFIRNYNDILGSSFLDDLADEGMSVDVSRYTSNQVLVNPIVLRSQDPTAVLSSVFGAGAAELQTGVAGAAVQTRSGTINQNQVNTTNTTTNQGNFTARTQNTPSTVANASLAGGQNTSFATQVATTGVSVIDAGIKEPVVAKPHGDAPLPGVSIKIQGVRKGGGHRQGKLVAGGKVTLATGKSNSDGEFTIELTNPKYANNGDYERVLLEVNSPDFKSYSYEIDLADFDEAVDIDVGEHVLTARTYEFEPSFVLQKAEQFPGVDAELEVTLYRKASDLDEHEYLHYEGTWSAPGARERKTFGSEEYVGVARKTISLKDQKNNNFPKLFYSSSLQVEITAKEPFIEKRRARLTVSRNDAQGDNELVVKPEYLLTVRAPDITGTVMANQANIKTGIENAYVQVTYDKDDVVLGSMPDISDLPFNNRPEVDLGGQRPVSGVHTLPGNQTPISGVWKSTTTGGGSQVHTLSVNSAVNNAANNAEVVSQIGGGVLQTSFQAQPSAVSQINEGVWDQFDRYSTSQIAAMPNTVATSANGEYTVRNLPLLKKGAKFQVRLMQVPGEYRHMKVDTAGRDLEIDVFGDGNSDVHFVVDANPMTIKGQLVDAKGKGLFMRNMRIRDNQAFDTDADGNFEVASFMGDQIIDIKGKLGYIDTAFSINFPNRNNIPLVLNVGKIGFLKQKVTKALFTVIEKDNPNEILADVEIRFGDTTHRTNGQGQWLYEGPGGKTAVTFTPPAESGYVAIEQDIDMDGSGVEKEYVISLEQGVKLFGKVQSGGQDLANSTVTIDEKDYLKATTDSSGMYTLYAPKGDRMRLIKAAKSGYYTEEKEQQTEDGEIELNFTLRDGDGKNISTLLGFDIELDESKEEDSKTLWSGKFINLEAYQSVFEGSKKQSLAFKKLEVTFDADGNAIPKDNEVVTDVKTLRLKLFDYLPIFMRGDDDKALKVIAQPDGMGSIAGNLQIDVKQWVKNDIGIKMGNIKHALLKKYNTTGPATVEAFNANSESTMPEVSFVLSKKDTADVSLELFGFEMNIDLAKTIVSQNGFATAGYVKTPELGIIKADSIGIDTLKISRQFGLEQIKFDENLPNIEIGKWVANLGKVSMDEFGFNMDGNIKIDSLSASNLIDFEKLSFTKEGLFGGKFTLPANGLSVQGLVSVKAGSTPLSFQQKSGVYSLAGSAKFKFDKFIDKEIKVKSFEVQTDGRYFVDVPVDYSVNMGFASYRLEGINIRNEANAAPSLTLAGEFKVSGLNAFKMSASDINFSVGTDGNTKFSVDSISASFKVPIFEADIALGILDSTGVRGFSGAGAFSVPETQIGASVEFAYKKYTQSNSFALSAGFRAGAIIPIGAVTLDSLGGGFAYDSGKKKFEVEIGANVSIAGADKLARLRDLKLGVTSNSGQNASIIVKGTTDIEVGSIINLATAKVTLDTEAKHFEVKIDGEFAPIDNLAEFQINGNLIVQWDPADTYVFLGIRSNVEIADIIEAQADFAIGVNVKNPRSNEDVKKYFTNLDPSLARNTFTGALLTGKAGVSVKFDEKVKLGWLKVAGVKGHVSASSRAVYFVNFADGRELLMRMEGDFSLGVSVSVLKWDVAGFEAGACYGIGGGYQSNKGWNFDGYAGVYAKFWVGNELGCGNWAIVFEPRGAMICFDAFAHLNYQNKKFTLKGGKGKNEQNNCN